jgi:glycosyltransferase involved in cell wall biosynthesis
VRIAVDARELQGHATGVGTYLSGILTEWKTLPAAGDHQVILCESGPTGSHGTWWEQRTLPRLVAQSNADVLFAPGYTAPILAGVPTVVAIHDVSFAAHPEWFGWREGLRRRMLTRVSARRAARVLTISEFSKREIVKYLGIGPEKVEVIYPAVADREGPRRSTESAGTRGPREDAARPRRSSPAASEGGTARDNLILYAGSLFNRRHLPELIEGFARLARRMPDARLEIVGDNRTIPRIDIESLVAASGAADRIALHSYLPDAALSARYARAQAFVFLSEYEGFGLTPLEALSAGVPIVVLDTPVAREVYGSAALYVERPEPALIDAALARLLTDEAERARILAAGRDTLARYSWRTCAARVLEVLISCSGCRASR